MREPLQLRVEELKCLKEDIISNSRTNLMFSKFYLCASPVVPILVTIKNNSEFDIEALLLNYLLIGVPLATASVVLRKKAAKDLDEWKSLDEELSFFIDDEENRNEYEELRNRVSTKRKIKIFKKD